MNVDGEFAPIKPLIQGMPGGPKVNLASANEHVPEIERRIRVVKERCRAIRHSLPYNRIPRLLTIWIVFNSVEIIELLPNYEGGSFRSVKPERLL